MASARERLAQANRENKIARGNTSTNNTIYTDYINRDIEKKEEEVIDLKENIDIKENIDNKEEQEFKENTPNENKGKTFDFVIAPSNDITSNDDMPKVAVNFSISQLAANVVFVKSKQDGLTLSNEMDKIFRELMLKEAANPSKVEISFENVKRTKRKGERIKESFILHKDIKKFINDESRRRLMSMSEFVETILEEFAK